jgi:alanyl-tRNA synthetase
VKEGNINAATIIKEIANEINGSGGGQPFLATAGGKNPAGIQRALAKAAGFLQKDSN